MKKVTQNSIVNQDDDVFDNRFLFTIPKNAAYGEEVDMAELLLGARNESLDYKKDYKLWSEVYSPKDELAIFGEIFEDAVQTGKRIHISNISLAEEIDMVKKLYLELGYFNKELNCFKVDFVDSPVTIGVNLNNVIYSFKDYKQMKEKLLFVPPPREPRHQKAIKSAINSGVISTISLDGASQYQKNIRQMITEEKTSLTRLASVLYHNYIKRGFAVEDDELVISI